MKPPVLDRLVLPAAMLALLVLSLAYWWLENLPHELFGTALFLGLVWHLVVNRYWFKNLFRGRYDVRRAVVVALHVLLILNMLVLVLTSIVISKSVFAWLPIPDSIYLREVHWFSAYWVIMIVGVHLGLHWLRVMVFSRSAFGLASDSAARSAALRFAALFLAVLGLWSFSVLEVWGKLTFTYSLDVWNFRTWVTPFFVHWGAVVALPAIAAHYGMILWRHLSRSRSPKPGSRHAGPASSP